MIVSVLVLLCLKPIYGLRVHIVGISSGLGRELAYQALTEYDDIYISGMCSNPYKQVLHVPYREGGLSDKFNNTYFHDDNKLHLFPYDDMKIFSQSSFNTYDALVFTTSGSAFAKYDFSDTLTLKTLSSISESCEYIQCVSAYGVENNWTQRAQNTPVGIVEKIGIQGMKDFYLREVYRAKEKQETILKEFSKSNGIKVDIFRPKVLSFGETRNICATPRERLARMMLEKINNTVLLCKSS